MPFRTAHENKTITQIVVNEVLLHSEFGINAGLPDLSRHCIQPQKAGIIATAVHNNARFSALRMLDGLSVILLEDILAYLLWEAQENERLTRIHKI